MEKDHVHGQRTSRNSHKTLTKSTGKPKIMINKPKSHANNPSQYDWAGNSAPKPSNNPIRSFLNYVGAGIVVILTCIVITDIFAPPFPNYSPSHLPNDCMVDSIEFKCAYDAANQLNFYHVWSRVALMSYKNHDDKEVGHAMCIFAYAGRIYSYDPALGSNRVLHVDYSNRNNIIDIGLELKCPGDIDNIMWADETNQSMVGDN